MWICIMTLSMVGAIYYLVFFYRHVQANSTHRLASLVRASIAVSRGNTANQNIRKIIQNSLGRARVLMTITALFILCWYPLFTLTLVDPKFKQPTKVYKMLTFIAWSNAALNPLVLILFDRNINIFRRIPCCSPCSACFMYDEERDERSSPLMSSRSHSPHSLRRSGSRNNPPHLTATVYQRVGCRLCHEGQTHTNTQCNGGVGKGNLQRDTSICELHNLSMCWYLNIWLSSSLLKNHLWWDSPMCFIDLRWHSYFGVHVFRVAHTALSDCHAQRDNALIKFTSTFCHCKSTCDNSLVRCIATRRRQIANQFITFSLMGSKILMVYIPDTCKKLDVIKIKKTAFSIVEVCNFHFPCQISYSFAWGYWACS